MHIGEKIRKLREDELELGRAKFSEIAGIPKQTLINVETGKTDPRVSTLLKIVEKYPEYTLWILSSDVDFLKTKQIRPKR